MAIIWQKNINGTKYQVRSAGRTRRLYTNNVCHSEFNPAKLLTGSIWDLLILAALFYPPRQLRRILVLGVGGGAAILQLHQLLSPDEIVGVELNPVHLDIARRFFNIDSTAADLHQADAREWLADYAGEAFDLIIDDLFKDDNQQPERAFAADREWFELLLSNLTRRGTLVFNFASQAEFKESAGMADERIHRGFKSVYRLSSPLLDNSVGAFLGIDSEAAELRKAIQAHPLLGPALQSKQLRYRIRKQS